MIKKILIISGLALLGVACADGGNKNSMSDPISTGSIGDAASSIMGGEGTKYVKVPHLYVRSGPGMKYETLSTLPFGKAVNIIKTVRNGVWAKIGEGQYVGTRYLSDKKQEKAWVPPYAH